MREGAVGGDSAGCDFSGYNMYDNGTHRRRRKSGWGRRRRAVELENVGKYTCERAAPRRRARDGWCGEEGTSARRRTQCGLNPPAHRRRVAGSITTFGGCSGNKGSGPGNKQSFGKCHCGPNVGVKTLGNEMRRRGNLWKGSIDSETGACKNKCWKRIGQLWDKHDLASGCNFRVMFEWRSLVMHSRSLAISLLLSQVVRQ